ncbi:MAG: hypothetical protein ACETWM_21085 [Candidatus Lokiarchaeia archaeon]
MGRRRLRGISSFNIPSALIFLRPEVYSKVVGESQKAIREVFHLAKRCFLKNVVYHPQKQTDLQTLLPKMKKTSKNTYKTV